MQLPLPLLAVQHPPYDAEIVVELLETEDVSNDTSFCKLLRACKNSPYFQNMVQLFSLMQIMLLPLQISTLRRKAGKQQIDIIFIVRKKVLSKEKILSHYQNS